MIAQSKVDEIKRLLATGKYSFRKIAELARVSRGSVGRIANGERRDRLPAEKTEALGPFDGPIRRCPECGGRVHMPCRYCETRHFIAESDDFSSTVDLEDLEELSLGMELKDEHRERYEAVYQKRLAKEEAAWEYGGYEEEGSGEEEEDDLLLEMFFAALQNGEITDAGLVSI